MTQRLIIDLETNGLLQEVTKIHCISVVDADSSYSELYVGEERIKHCIEKLELCRSTELIGHNIFCYDLKVLEKLYGFKHPGKIHDTLILAQLLYPDLKNEEDKGLFPGKIFSKRDTGSHSLRAWGQRVMCYKGEYTGGWEEYSDEMGKYCIGDTYSTKTLFHFLESKVEEKLLSREPIDLEYSIAPILARQQAYGVLFDKEKADNLILMLTEKMYESKIKLQELFKPRYVSEGEFEPKVNNKSKGIVKGAKFTKVKLEEFNPSSRQQIVSRLKAEFNWNPEEFTETGQAKMNEDIIDALPFKELAPLKEYLTIQKRISQIETGAQAWTKKVDKDGRIRGAIRQNGAVTGRMAHFSPNMAQIPSNDSLYGKECRELFIVGKDKIMIGVDADALEMRCLAGYLSQLDQGRFMNSLLKGSKEDGTDPHSINASAMQVDRETAKTIFYAMIYGARNAKIGKILFENGINFYDYVPEFEKSLKGMLEWVKKKNEASTDPLERSDMYWKCWVAGKHCLELFGERLPELPSLVKLVLGKIKERGYIKGLDGRKLFCRSEHGALNTVLQSAGAIIMKKALYIADTTLQNQGLTPGEDYEFVLNVHDEFELEVTNKKEIVDKVCQIVENSIYEAGLFFNFPCPQKGNSQIATDWSGAH